MFTNKTKKPTQQQKTTLNILSLQAAARTPGRRTLDTASKPKKLPKTIPQPTWLLLSLKRKEKRKEGTTKTI